jgi:trigger factor
MVASKNIERREHSSVMLTVTVAAADCKKEYDKLISEYSKSVAIPGFRKGKVPATVLERKFGDGLRIDCMGRVLEAAVEEAIKDIPEKPIAYSQPSLEGTPDFALDKDFTFAVTYDIFPEFAVPDWKGLSIELPEVTLGLDDEERELAAIRDRNAIVMEKASSAAAEKGDVATIDSIELDADDLAVAGSARQDFTFEIGSGFNLYKLDDEVLGMKAGESKTISKTFAADYEHAELAGRSVKVQVTLSKLKEKKLPDLDDDFAQDVSEKYATLADLKTDIKAQLERRLESKIRETREKSLVEALMKRATVDLPASMVETELAMRLEGMMRQMGLDSIDKLDRLLGYSGKTRADLFGEWRPNAEKSIATRFVLERLVEEGKYACSDAELEAELARIATESNMSVDEVKAEYEKRGNLEYLRDRIREDRLMADILAAATVKKGKKLAFVDLVSDNQ